MARHRKGESEEAYAFRREQEAAERAAKRAVAEQSAARDEAPRRQPRSYAADVAALLLPVNEIVRVVPGLAEDALNDDELADAIKLGDQAAQRYPRVRKLLRQAEQVSFTGACIAFAIRIAIPRLARRDLLPPWVRQALARAQEAAAVTAQMPPAAEQPIDPEQWTQYQTWVREQSNGSVPAAPTVFAPGMPYGVR